MHQILGLEDDGRTVALMKAGKKLDCFAANRQSDEESCDFKVSRYLFIDVTCEKGDSIALTGIFHNEFPMMFY
jgi:hypothetical protein